MQKENSDRVKKERNVKKGEVEIGKTNHLRVENVEHLKVAHCTHFLIYIFHPGLQW